MNGRRTTAASRLVGWIWISAVVTGGAVFAVYFLANRMTPAFIVLGVVLGVAAVSHLWVRRSEKDPKVARGPRRKHS